MALRRKLNATMLTAFLNFTLTLGSELHGLLFAYLPKEDEHDMDVDTATSGTQTVTKHSFLELEIYCYFLMLIFLIDQKRCNEVKSCVSASIVQLKNIIRRAVDFLASRLYFCYSLGYELIGGLAEIRGNLLSLLWIVTLCHDKLGQAKKLQSKAPRFGAHSNQQFCRYLL